MALTTNERRALINMTLAGTLGPYPAPDNDLNNIPDLRHLIGLYRFEGISIATPTGIADDGDIYMEYSSTLGGQIFVDNTDLRRDKGLRTAVLISLLTDRIAEDTDVLPDNTGHRRGWHADPSLGSRLWLLFRSSFTPDIPSRIEEFTKEALNWMLLEGVAANVIVNATRTDIKTVTWTIQIIKPGGEGVSNFKYFFNWENELFGEVT